MIVQCLRGTWKHYLFCASSKPKKQGRSFYYISKFSLGVGRSQNSEGWSEANGVNPTFLGFRVAGQSFRAYLPVVRREGRNGKGIVRQIC